MYQKIVKVVSQKNSENSTQTTEVYKLKGKSLMYFEIFVNIMKEERQNYLKCS